MRLDKFNKLNFKRGASSFKEFLWMFCSFGVFSSWLPGSSWRVKLLRIFGAKIGHGVVIKPKVKIKFPWKLTIGNYCWIGEGVWIDNLDLVTLENYVCISQGAYLCTGSHNWSRVEFDLITKPITLCQYTWICSYCRIAPGVIAGEGSVLGFSSVATSSLKPWIIYSGFPALPIKARKIMDASII